MRIPNPLSWVIKPIQKVGDTMLQNLILQLLKKALYAVGGQLIAFLGYIVAFKPDATDPLTTWLFMAIAAGATGLIALIKRAMTWDPSKV